MFKTKKNGGRYTLQACLHISPQAVLQPKLKKSFILRSLKINMLKGQLKKRVVKDDLFRKLASEFIVFGLKLI
jgi:hypothetical protein